MSGGGAGSQKPWKQPSLRLCGKFHVECSSCARASLFASRGNYFLFLPIPSMRSIASVAARRLVVSVGEHGKHGVRRGPQRDKQASSSTAMVAVGVQGEKTPKGRHRRRSSSYFDPAFPDRVAVDDLSTEVQTRRLGSHQQGMTDRAVLDLLWAFRP